MMVGKDSRRCKNVFFINKSSQNIHTSLECKAAALACHSYFNSKCIKFRDVVAIIYEAVCLRVLALRGVCLCMWLLYALSLSLSWRARAYSAREICWHIHYGCFLIRNAKSFHVLYLFMRSHACRYQRKILECRSPHFQDTQAHMVTGKQKVEKDF